MDPFDLVTWRYVGAFMAAPAFGCLFYRLFSTWHRIDLLSHVLGAIATAYVLVGAVGQYLLIKRDAPGSEMSPVIASLNVAIIVACIVWPRIVGKKVRLPVRPSTPPTERP